MEKFTIDFEKANQLAEKYMGMGYHCSEAAVRALLEVLHGSADPKLIKVSTSFMGGVAGSHDQICGAVSGGLIVLGSLYGRSEAGVNDDFLAEVGKEFLKNFTHNCGANSVICDELRDRRTTPSCTPYVQCAVLETLRLIQKYQG